MYKIFYGSLHIDSLDLRIKPPKQRVQDFPCCHYTKSTYLLRVKTL